jgi:hypothetical protein
LKVLVACEFSGVVRDAFIKQGHDAISCDLIPTERDGPHVIGDVSNLLQNNFDLVIAHPPCTFLANSGVQYLHEGAERWRNMKKARDFFLMCLNANAKYVCVENPVPHNYAQLPYYTQIIHPWQFGHEVQKRTCLWLKNLPELKPTSIVSKGRAYIGKDGKANGSYWYQVESVRDRQKIRSRSFEGIADAMARQWGVL